MQAELLAKSGEAVKSGPIGLAVILLLCIACYFLFKSMSRHLKSVREEFPNDEGAAPPTDPNAAPPTGPNAGPTAGPAVSIEKRAAAEPGQSTDSAVPPE
ncbi:MAG: hypothetical protein QOC66_193 [Pseudonocardiales bacterium]|jgi:hypothetical protein|nr:hypothetical protein [Pseudonocardiales bacterium]